MSATSFYDICRDAMEQTLYGPQQRFPVQVELGGQSYSFAIWNGEQLPDPLLALDTETELITDNRIPRLALATICGSSDSCFLLHPGRLSAFIRQHSQAAYCCHNSCFDFWAIAQHLQTDQQALAAWWQIAGEGRLLCTMLLDALLRLADNDAEPTNRALDVVAAQYAGLQLDKQDPYRLRYGELVGLPLEQWQYADAGFWTYACKDPVATLLVCQAQLARAKQLMQPHKHQLLPDAWQRFGPLTCALQVQGAIALEQIGRTGICVDLQRVQQLQGDIASQVQQQLELMQELGGAELFKRYKRGERAGQLMHSKSGLAKRDSKAIKAKLEQIAQQHGIKPPKVKNGSISDAGSFWSQHTEADPFVAAYVGYYETSGLLKFFAELSTDRIHPRYIPLVRTGRTSCRSPNLQQLPRDSRFREMIVAPPGSWLLQVDYSVLELRVLAEVCLRRFGRSRLAELFQAGQDPHKYTAALLLGLTPEQFAQLPAAEQKQHRQRAKAVNFGVPGGLGPASLVSYAAASFGVQLTLDEAKELRRKLCEEVYPELAAYLQDQPWQMLAANLQCSEAMARQAFSRPKQIDAAFRIVAGETATPGGDEYSAELIAHIWLCLQQLNQNTELALLIAAKQPSLALARRIFWGPALAISGRVRGHVGFTQRCNSPFQALAADGAKLALFRLLRAGIPICGFIHDEVLLAIPDGCDYGRAVSFVQQIMQQSMQELTPAIPIKTEFLLADRWYKDAPEQPHDAQGRLLPYCRPEAEQPAAPVRNSESHDQQKYDFNMGYDLRPNDPAAQQVVQVVGSYPANTNDPQQPATQPDAPAAATPAPATALLGKRKRRRAADPEQRNAAIELASFADPLQLGLQVKPNAAASVEVTGLTSIQEQHEPQAARPAVRQLTQPLKWHGGKYYLAKRILELMPPHLHYVEPFAGGLAVLLARDPGNCSEVINDLNGQLTNFWQVLRDPQRFELFRRQVEATPFSQIEFAEALEQPASSDPVAAAVQFFVRMRQSRQGIGKDFATLSRSRTRRNMNEQASSWLSAVEGLADIHQRLRRVVILNQDAITTIKQQDGPQTCFYCDPPYQHSTRSSTGEYACEMTDEQHRQLLEVLAKIEGKLVLSGYHSELYDTFAQQQGWHLVETEIDNKASSAKRKEKKTECLWMNYQPTECTQ